MKLIAQFAIVLAISIVSANGEGKLTYGDKCSVHNAIIGAFTNTQLDESEKCNFDQGLICTGTCTCPPTRVWNRGPLFGVFGGNGCIAGANGPCAKGDRCVENAKCGENLPLCFCVDGYHAHELQCIQSSRTSGASSNRAFSPNQIISVLGIVLLRFIVM